MRLFTSLFLAILLCLAPVALAVDPIVDVTYLDGQFSGANPCFMSTPYGYGVLTVINPCNVPISDINIGYNGTTRYMLPDGSPLFPVHFNEILPGASRNVTFIFNLSTAGPVTITERVVCMSDPDCETLDCILCHCPGGICMKPGVLINIRNSGAKNICISSFVKAPPQGAYYTCVVSSSGRAYIDNRYAVVKGMTIPAKGCGYILIGVQPTKTGDICLPDGTFTFCGDPLDMAGHMQPECVSNANVSLNKAPIFPGYELSAGFINDADARCLLRSITLREGINFNDSDRLIRVWEPMVVLMPGQGWASDRLIDWVPGSGVYNIATNFTLLFNVTDDNLVLRVKEPVLHAPMPLPSPSPSPSCSPSPSISPSHTQRPSVMPSGTTAPHPSGTVYPTPITPSGSPAGNDGNTQEILPAFDSVVLAGSTLLLALLGIIALYAIITKRLIR